MIRFLKRLLTPRPRIKCPRCVGMKTAHRNGATTRCQICKGVGTVKTPRREVIP